MVLFRCQLCADDGYYLDVGTSQCLLCPEVGRGIALLVGLLVGIAVLLALCRLAFLHPGGGRLALLRPWRRVAAWLACYVKSIGLLPKLKILFSFLGIATALDQVYDAKMPVVYTVWVEDTFSWVQIDWVSHQHPASRTGPSRMAHPSSSAWVSHRLPHDRTVKLAMILCCRRPPSSRRSARPFRRQARASGFGC